MKRSLILGFVLVLLLAELGARWLAPQLPGQLIWNNQFTQDKSEQIARVGSVELAYVGSSVTNAGIDPRLVSEASGWGIGYNAGLPSTTPSVWKVWSRDLVFPDLCPNVFVLGISIRDYNDNNIGVAPAVSKYVQSAGRLQLYGERTGISLEEQVGEYSAFIAVRSRLRQPEKVGRFLLWGSVPEWPATSLTEEGRYLSWDDNVFVAPTPEGATWLRDRVFVDFSTGGSEDRAVREMIEEAQQLGMAVAVVRMPAMNDGIVDLLPDGQADLDEFEQQLVALGVDFNVPVIMFPDMDNTEGSFGDLYHMNLTGTTEFSRRLGEELSRVIVLPEGSMCGERPESSQVTAVP